MSILYRSYEHLPEHLQRCFAYCSLFPKDYHLKPDRLVQMWIANGFVLPQARKSSEEVGRDYFNGLLARSFIQMVKHDYKENYVMHDLMNDLACHVSKGECYILDSSDCMNGFGSVRHLSVTHAGFEVLRTMHGLDKLRTLILLNYDRFDDNSINVLNKLKRIRVLEFGWNSSCLPDVGEWKHLRYLCFQNPLNKFPANSFSKLHHLTVLLIKSNQTMNTRFHCCTQKKYLTIPKGICRLQSLDFVDTSKMFTVDVGGLAQFQNFWRGGSAYLHVKKEKWHGVDQLGNINNIKGFLRICGLENVTNREEAIKAQLGSKQHVTELALEWSDFSSKVNRKYHEVFEALNPNPSIEKLYISGYPGALCPSWLESNLFSRIESIKLCKCNGLEILPALGQLPLLRNLWFETMKAVRSIGLEFYGNGTFPSLEEFVINKLSSLEEWFYPCDVQVFPKLHKLRIVNCPKFVQSEWDGLPALQNFEISSCDAMWMKAQFKGYGCLLALIKLDIINCNGIVTLEGLCELVSLEILYIKHCPNLLSLPEMELFYSLKFLAISECQKLRSLPKKGLPVSLEVLYIDRANLLEDQIRSKQGTEWHKVAAIPGCNCFISQDWISSMENTERIIVDKVPIACAICRLKILRSAASVKGTQSIMLDAERGVVVMTITGSSDPLKVHHAISKKVRNAELVSVGPAQRRNGMQVSHQMTRQANPEETSTE